MAAQLTAGTPRRVRQIRAAVVLLLALAFLGGAFYKAYSYIQEDTSPESAKASDCMTGTAQKPIAKVSDAKVNVYNATSTPGLAAKVAGQLRERGYSVVEIDNDPLKKKVKGTGEIRYGTPGVPFARAVRLALNDAKFVNDKRTDSTIDLVIGDKFTELSPPPTCSSATAG
ncbi:conserved hypothetical protein [Nostocoides australiense Ben110]|uniref:LytR/CpsA/Psr regulator C-terminal domain-containing protein n=1 Tax=Nostocoides australiense Ben110 TaxID=1193182 RepID=W6K279_9MICO|nr:LytR C-terminal domain-containing protein [Tetrasphaera australiensis]CCH75221.1 conserved hypothetical protein [Tetrasphaera australiensis Ben110]